MAKLRVGMVGGGADSLIGDAHRQALSFYNEYELVCGTFSRDREKSLDLNKRLGLSPSRIYSTYDEMITQEARLPANERMQVICITTPNNSHFAIAQSAMQHGFHVMLEKPVTVSYESALKLRALAKKYNTLCCVNYTYAGFPMVKLAREKIKQGELGQIRKVYVEYHQGWMSELIEKSGLSRTSWRQDPQQSGMAGAMADIGSHAFHLVEYVTNIRVKDISSVLNTLVPERLLDDDGAVFLRFDNQASGVLTVCQAAFGEDNHLKIKVYGEQGHLKWTLARPDELKLNFTNKPETQLCLLDDADPHLKCKNAIQAMANHYHQLAQAISSKGKKGDFPDLDEGARGLAFIETCVRSNQSPEQKWHMLPNLPTLATLNDFNLFSHVTEKVDTNEEIIQGQLQI